MPRAIMKALALDPMWINWVRANSRHNRVPDRRLPLPAGPTCARQDRFGTN